jgi:hypothetical protein
VQNLFNKNFEYKKQNLLRAFSRLACFGSLTAVGLVLGQSGCRSHFLVCKLLMEMVGVGMTVLTVAVVVGSG